MTRRTGKRSKTLIIAGLLAVFLAGCGSAKASTSTTASPPPSAAFDWVVAQSGKSGVPGWLDGVDCVTATSCVAVGSEYLSGEGGAEPLVETMDDGAWTNTIAPTSTDEPGTWLMSVSCPEVGICLAVGYEFSLRDTGSASYVVEALSKGHWSLVSVPSPGADIIDSFLNGVSCTGLSSCVAVGYDETSSFVAQPLVLSFSDGTWSVSSSSSPGPLGGDLTSVSCVRPGSCVAAGFEVAPGSTHHSLVETSTGGKWSVTASLGSAPIGPVLTGLDGVDCPTTSSCVAVGKLGNPGPVVEVANGQEWSGVDSPDPNPSDASSALYGVSCTVSYGCLAVGDFGDPATAAGKYTPAGAFGGPLGALMETGYGGQWNVTTPPPGLPVESGLHAVSCAGTTCVAVGQTGNFQTPSGKGRTLIIQSLSTAAS